MNDAVMGFHSIPQDCRAADIFSDFGRILRGFEWENLKLKLHVVLYRE